MSRKPAIKKKSSFGEDGEREDDDRHVDFGEDTKHIIFPTIFHKWILCVSLIKMELAHIT